jgi:hypothetical protein
MHAFYLSIKINKWKLGEGIFMQSTKKMCIVNKSCSERQPKQKIIKISLCFVYALNIIKVFPVLIISFGLSFQCPPFACLQTFSWLKTKLAWIVFSTGRNYPLWDFQAESWLSQPPKGSPLITGVHRSQSSQRTRIQTCKEGPTHLTWNKVASHLLEIRWVMGISPSLSQCHKLRTHCQFSLLPIYFMYFLIFLNSGHIFTCIDFIISWQTSWKTIFIN